MRIRRVRDAGKVFAGFAPVDLNGDGIVNGVDLATLLTNWGPCPAPPAECPADISGSGDGIVNGADLATLLTNWGTP